MQYQCVQSDDTIISKREQGLGIVCIGVFATTIYMLTIFYLNHTANLDYKMWDLTCVTAADFTAELTITEDMWNELYLKMN